MNCNSNNITPAIARSESGKWHAGSSGKPSGGHGPRQINLVATLRRKVAAQAERSCKRGQVVSGDRISDRICDELIDLALHCKVAKVKLMAITAILDRLEGKPVTPVAIAPAELELVQRVRLAYDSVMKFAAANDLQMTPAEAVAWVAARESRAREILSEFITIDLMPEPAAAPAADDAAADANGTGVHTVQVHTVHHRQVMRLRDRDRQPQPILSSMQPGAATTRHRQGLQLWRWMGSGGDCGGDGEGWSMAATRPGGVAPAVESQPKMNVRR